MWKNDPDWFKQWFNTREYHLLYGHRSQEEASGFIRRLSEQSILASSNQTIMDIGCGEGRHAASMAAEGHHVTGLDLSSNSIQAAKQLHVDYSSSLRFVCGDMREIDTLFQPSSFDVVTMMFTSFGYFETEEEHLRTLEAIRTVLRKDGTFVLDFLNLEQVQTDLVSHERIRKGEVDFEINRRIADGWIEKSIQFEDITGTKQLHVERVRAFSTEYLRVMLHSAGFEFDEVFGDYDLIPLVKSSPRCIIVAQ
jgi:SAM-dependent methyltransferase